MKIILFVLLDQWADWEAAYLASALRMLGQNEYAVKTVSLSTNAVESIGGFRVVPDFALQTAPEEYEALVLVGGMSWRSEEAKQVKPLVDRCLAQGRVLGGICDAAGFLGAVGALNGVRHTGNDLDDLKAWAGDAYTNEKNFAKEQAVRDGGVVTANGTAALEFAKEVLFALNAAPQGKILGWYEFHKQGWYNISPESAAAWQEEK